MMDGRIQLTERRNTSRLLAGRLKLLSELAPGGIVPLLSNARHQSPEGIEKGRLRVSGLNASNTHSGVAPGALAI